jgi:sec-independent protein translocase protein TatA
MDFLGLGPFEILTVLIVAFLIFGPEKLPGMAAKAGQWYRKFTRTASNITRAINEEMSVEPRPDAPPTNDIAAAKKAETGPKTATPGEKKAE